MGYGGVMRTGWDRTARDYTAWVGMLWHGFGGMWWDGMRRDETGWDGVGWVGMGVWVGMGWRCLDGERISGFGIRDVRIPKHFTGS